MCWFKSGKENRVGFYASLNKNNYYFGEINFIYAYLILSGNQNKVGVKAKCPQNCDGPQNVKHKCPNCPWNGDLFQCLMYERYKGENIFCLTQKGLELFNARGPNDS